MRSLAGVLLMYALSVLLASTSPIGTGQGAHQFQLVDELLPHVHIVNGQRVQVWGAQTAGPLAGPALGAAAGASAAISPGMELAALVAPLASRVPGHRLLPDDALLPAGRAEPPPVPPPPRQS